MQHSISQDDISCPAKLTGVLLICGVVAGPIYIIVGGIEMLTRPGFDPTRHDLSLMSNGDWGWIHISLLVLTGVTSPAELLAAGPERRPTYLSADVRGLLNVHDRPRVTDAGAVCGRWRATTGPAGSGPRRLLLHDTEDATVADGEADDLDALRALCAISWASGAEGPVRVAAAGADGTRGQGEQVIERLGLADRSGG